MIDKKEKTAPNVSVGADTEQSIQKCTDNIITDRFYTSPSPRDHKTSR